MIESEKKLEKLLVENITQKHKGLCLKLQSPYFNGLPDRMCLLPGGKIFFVEVKTTGKKPRRIQLKVHEKLKALGFRVEVVDSTKQIEELL